ncbi:MAG: ABC transporter ATP-binding protein [Pseudomonadota bacterium]
MRALLRKMLNRAGDFIDFRVPADGPPPDRFGRFLAWALRGGWPVIWIGITISILSGATEVLSIYLLGAIVDAVDTTEANFLADHAGIIILSVVVLLIVRPLLFGGLAITQSVMIAPNIFSQVLARLFRWTLGQSVTFFDNDFAGRIAQKQVQASTSLTEIVVETVNAITFGLATVLGTAFLLGSISPWMLLVFAGWFASYLGFLAVMLPRIRRRAAARAEAKAMVSGQVVDTISNVKTVKLFAQAQHEDDKALGAMGDLRERALEFGEVQTLFRFGLIFIAGVLPIALVTMAVALRSSGISPGDVAATGAVAIRLAQMTGWISFTLMGIYSHVGEVQDGINTLAPPDRIYDKDQAHALVVPAAAIRFDDVAFSYGRQSGGIDRVSLDIPAGQKLALVGASGAGKSTLVSLLLRIYDPERGKICIDGQDIAEVTQESLRAQIGMVTQDTAMFNRTAFDNIRYGRPDASLDEVIEAAKKAEAHEFIVGLEDHKGRKGYDAYLGERGVKLSGGQRQRIALARVILKDAPILVLDEATSALDSEVEAAIQDTLGRMMDGKTVIAIAHRLSTIAQLDRIVVLNDGRIIEDGSHRALSGMNGAYARFWDRQSGGFLATAEAAE